MSSTDVLPVKHPVSRHLKNFLWVEEGERSLEGMGTQAHLRTKGREGESKRGEEAHLWTIAQAQWVI